MSKSVDSKNKNKKNLHVNFMQVFRSYHKNFDTGAKAETNNYGRLMEAYPPGRKFSLDNVCVKMCILL